MRRPAATGPVIVVAGPDGSGKTAVADALTDQLSGAVLRLHHRPQVLPAKTTHSGPVTEPHKNPPYSQPLSLAKIVYLYLDYLLGWALHLRPWVRAGGAVIFERGWWDLVVDPRRYRLAEARATSVALRVFGRLLPRPTMTVVLHAPPHVLTARKAELPEPELVRQMRAWSHQPAKQLRPCVVDVQAPLGDVVRRIVTDARWHPPPPARRIQLPVRRQVRWNLPAAPRHLARAALLIHHPMTPVGLGAWHAARAAAGLGAFRLLPAAPEPPDPVTARVHERVGRGSVLAVARSNHAGRYAVLVLSPRGRPTALVKVALEETGIARLEREAERQRYAELLPDPLFAPKMLYSDDGMLVFEPVRWRTRAEPWSLPSDVAESLGHFHRGAHGCEALSHGDFAPWNLMRTRHGWAVIDWEEAGQDRPAFEDPFHFLVQGHALLGRPLADELLDGLRGHGWVGESLAAYSRSSGIPMSRAPGLFGEYLERTTILLDDRDPDERAALEARQALLKRL